VNAWRRDHPDPDQQLTHVERARVNQLQEENRRLRMENEFLKKPLKAFRRRTSCAKVPRPQHLGRRVRNRVWCHRALVLVWFHGREIEEDRSAIPA
jgi:transposase-like protein